MSSKEKCISRELEQCKRETAEFRSILIRAAQVFPEKTRHYAVATDVATKGLDYLQ